MVNECGELFLRKLSGCMDVCYCWFSAVFCCLHLNDFTLYGLENYVHEV